MYSNKQIISCILFVLLFVSSSVSAELNYEQEITLSSLKSEEDCKYMADLFLQSAIGDPDLKVIDVKYKQDELDKNCTIYDAVIMCHVSKPDEDVCRIGKKMIESHNSAVLSSNFKEPKAPSP